MKPEDFLEQHHRFNVWKAKEGGGWHVSCDSHGAAGDTLEDALEALHDHVMRNPSRRARVNPPMNASSAFEPFCNPLRISYDYRTTDWKPTC